MFLKLGESVAISRIESFESSVPMVSDDILQSFIKKASELKKIAPKAEDFLYFSCIMMHSAEASALNEDGSVKVNKKGEPVQVGWNTKNGTWKWETNDSNVKPYKNCFIPGTQILMQDGSSKNIEDIDVGDFVITHTGKSKKVLKKFITPHNGNLINLKVRNGRDITCTDNHPFYKLKTTTNSDCEDTSKHLLRTQSSAKNYEFIEASKLNNYDLLLSPVLDEIKDSELSEEQGSYYTLHSITDISNVEYNGNVYNFEVEDDNSYVANDIIVHNCNGDIFPEAELIKAYKKWVGKPLCIDHKSSSVDHVRGFIVDTYYDRTLKRVIALCALDKVNYPDLARKVSTGYSNNVSMGTAVGQAICTDCAQVARVEADFCDHMRNKSCYGEINVDLNPIELSIVVNGADPRAHIKQVMAALNNYVDGKDKELKKLAAQFTANISVKGEGFDNADGTSANVSISATDLDTFERDVKDAFDKLKNLSLSLDKNNLEDTNNSELNQSSDSFPMEDIDRPNTDLSFASPVQRFASDDVYLSELKEIRASIESKLNKMSKTIEQFKSFEGKSEKNMNMNKKGYYQGTEDPTPGEVKYPKDPKNEDLRESGDKQMVGQMDTGPVDGMHPGPDSVGMSELERKKMLARAESEERAIRRNSAVRAAQEALKNKTAQTADWVQLVTPAVEAVRNGAGSEAGNPMLAAGLKNKCDVGVKSEIVDFIVRNSLHTKFYQVNALLSALNAKVASLQSEAYFNGGGGVNEPTPGKVKYPADKTNENLREDGDKQMVGQKPFPGVGSVDGLHPSPSSADVSDELKRKQVLRRADQLKAKFVKASNRDGSFNAGNSSWQVYRGEQLILTASVNELTGGRAEVLYDSIATKEFGANLMGKVKVMGADKVRSLVKKAQDAGVPPVAAPAAPEVAPEAAPLDMSVPEAGSDKGSEDPRKQALELTEKIRGLSDDLVQVERGLQGEKKEMGELGDLGAAPEAGVATASFGTDALNSMRKELNSGLITAIGETLENLKDHKDELNMITDMYDNGVVTADNKEFVNSLVDDALTEAKTAVADGFKLMTAFVKYARGTSALVKRAQTESKLNKLADGEDMSEPVNSELMDLVTEANEDLNALKTELDSLDLDDSSSDSQSADDSSVDPDVSNVDDNDLEVKPEDLAKMLETKASRTELRMKLAADAIKESPMIGEAHPKGGFTTDLDVKPTGNLAQVETVEEVHDAMLDLANAPPKVRKQAEEIHKLVTAGKLDVSDLDELVAQGADAEAVSYYKKYWGQVEGGSEFASELLKEHAKAQLEAEMGKYRVKIARAYELAYDMADRGLCQGDRQSISSQVNDIMEYNDASFESMKKVVARHAPSMKKEAGRMPQVGLFGEESSAPVATDGDLYSELSAAFSTSKRRGF